MSDKDDGAERSHEPTQRKLDEARKKGEIAKSADLGAAASYVGLLAALWLAGPSALKSAGAALVAMLGQAPAVAQAGGSAMPHIFGAIAPFWPVFALPAGAALLAYVVQRAVVVAPARLSPKLSRISPVANAKNKFGPSGLFEFAKSFAKLLIYALVLAVFLRAWLGDLVALAGTAPGPVALALGRVSLAMLAIVCVAAGAIAAIDLIWQRHDHLRKHRMSHKELRDDNREAEGDPHFKQARRQRGQEIAMSQMMAEVHKADVVVVNPVHVAVALKWQPGVDRAPRCVAKGQDEVALRIRARAIEAGVPVRQDVATARALYATVALGDEIAPETYRAVAAAIRFAEDMRRKARARNRP